MFECAKTRNRVKPAERLRPYRPAIHYRDIEAGIPARLSLRAGQGEPFHFRSCASSRDNEKSPQ